MYRKVHALLLISEGEAFSDIAEYLRISVDSVYQWFRRFMAGGLSGWRRYPYSGRGRKPKLSQAQKDRLYDKVVAGPEANGFDCGIWNTAMIAELIPVKFGVIYHTSVFECAVAKNGTQLSESSLCLG